ncbi:Ankyrin Repeat Domain-Containing Protein Sowahb [Manis pentadactyla]|nr:Ankyrin Repeat Domain-Containing Protein Sowahb [Manis pentadactyla]
MEVLVKVYSGQWQPQWSLQQSNQRETVHRGLLLGIRHLIYTEWLGMYMQLRRNRGGTEICQGGRFTRGVGGRLLTERKQVHNYRNLISTENTAGNKKA